MKASVLSFCLLLCLIFTLIGILHYFVGDEAGSFVLYLLPIYLASEYGNLSFGSVSTVISIGLARYQRVATRMKPPPVIYLGDLEKGRTCSA